VVDIILASVFEFDNELEDSERDIIPVMEEL